MHNRNGNSWIRGRLFVWLATLHERRITMLSPGKRALPFFLIWVSLCVPLMSVEIHDKKLYGEAKDGMALVYLIRPGYELCGNFTTFVYADDKFLGVLKHDSYTFAHVEPGKHLFWTHRKKPFSGYKACRYLPTMSTNEIEVAS